MRFVLRRPCWPALLCALSLWDKDKQAGRASTTAHELAVAGFLIESCFWFVLQESTVETEVRAAHNVLEACAQTDAMERVVFTSSVTAVVWSGAGAGTGTHGHEEAVADEKSWSDLAFCRKFKVRATHARLTTTRTKLASA